MPLSIIAGIPLPILREHKAFAPEVPGWSVKVIPSAKGSDLSTCWKEVLALAGESPPDGTHILAYHKPEKERGLYEKRVYSHHRLVWLQPSDLRIYGSDDFNESIRRLLDFESEWRQRVRPESVASPLILPETGFDAEEHMRDLWRRGQWVRIGYDALDSVCRLSERFYMSHHTGDGWVDSRRRRFVYTGARHGGHVESARLWKYTFRVPDGFHFDVDCPSRGSFFFRDRQGDSYKVTSHINVDCHGHIR